MAEPKRWLLLRSGAKYTYGDLRCEGLDFEQDVVHTLARIARGNGQYNINWSVAAHAACAALVASDAGWPVKLQRLALHHDDAEALVGDIVSPLKQTIPAFYAYEEAAAQAVRRHSYKIDDEDERKVKLIDWAMLLAEAKLLRNGATFTHVETEPKLLALAMNIVKRVSGDGKGYGEPAARLYLNVMERLDEVEKRW